MFFEARISWYEFMLTMLWPWIVWLSLVVLLFTYIGYPFVLAVIARLRPNPLRFTSPRPSRVAIVMSVKNEAAKIHNRLSELAGLLNESTTAGEIIVVSDGSTDATAQIARGFSAANLRVIEWAENRGKASALTTAVGECAADVIIFADVRQRWNGETIPALLRNFEDPDVGAVSGELVLETSPNVLAGVGVYWRYEKWIRRTESRIHSQIGVTGAVSAVRRECFRDIPAGTILDDVYWPMQVALQSKRVVFEGDAKAFDQLPESARGEFRRKVRTLAGNFQLVTRCPRLLVPILNPLWGRFVSHKLLRLVCPWAWFAMLGASLLAGDGIYLAVFVGQCLLMLAGLVGLLTNASNHSRLFSAIGSFMLLNAAAWIAFWCWILSRTDKLWTPSTYIDSAVPARQE